MTGHAKGTPQSIIAHMNKDHKLALEDFLYVYGKVPITNRISSVRLQEFDLDHITIVFQHSDVEFDIEKVIPLEPPLANMKEARDRLVSMAKEAAQTRGFSHIKIDEGVHPKGIVEYIIVALVILPFVAYFKRDVLQYLPLTQGVRSFLSKDITIISFAVVTIIAHVTEAVYLLRPKLAKYRVPTDCAVEWYFLCLLEGYFSIIRFNKVVAERAH